MRPGQPQDPIYDPWHAAIIDRVCAGDRRRADAGERSFLRAAVPHELCRPAEPCVTWPTVVAVHVIATGARIRRPLGIDPVAA